MIGKQGTQLCHQEAKGYKTPHLRKTQSKQKALLYSCTHNLNPTQEGDGRRNQYPLTVSPAPVTSGYETIKSHLLTCFAQDQGE